VIGEYSTRSYLKLKYYSYGIKPSRNSIKTNIFECMYILYRRTVPHIGIMYIIYLCKIGNIGEYYVNIFIRILISLLPIIVCNEVGPPSHIYQLYIFWFRFFFNNFYHSVFSILHYYHVQVLEGLIHFGSNVTKKTYT